MLDNYENQHCNSTLKNILLAKYPELKRTDEKASTARDAGHSAADKVWGSFAEYGKGRPFVNAVAYISLVQEARQKRKSLSAENGHGNEKKHKVTPERDETNRYRG